MHYALVLYFLVWIDERVAIRFEVPLEKSLRHYVAGSQDPESRHLRVLRFDMRTQGLHDTYDGEFHLRRQLVKESVADKAGQHHCVDLPVLESFDDVEDVELSVRSIVVLVRDRITIVERTLFENDVEVLFVAFRRGGSNQFLKNIGPREWAESADDAKSFSCFRRCHVS